MDTPQERLRVLQREVEAFKSYLSSLSAAAWKQPSACDRWTVADVVSHIGSQGFASSITRGLAGDISPPEGRPAVADHNEDAFAESIAQRAFDTRAQQGDGLLTWFIRNLDESVRVFDSVGPDSWDIPCYWPPGPEPVRTLLDMRIAELTMHAWDVRSVLEPGYHLSDSSVRVLIDTIPRAVRRAFRPEPGLASPIRYRFVVGNPAVTSIDINVARDGTRISPATTESANATFSCDGETYVMVMYGRLSPDAAMANGRLTFEGDAKLAREFSGRFKGG